jgi:hypothetical protein
VAVGQTLTATASLIPGSAVGASGATAAGVTLSATAALLSGNARGDAVAAGQTLLAVAALIAGAAAGAGAITQGRLTVRSARSGGVAIAAIRKSNATAAAHATTTLEVDVS